MSDSKSPKRWTPEQDEALRVAVERGDALDARSASRAKRLKLLVRRSQYRVRDDARQARDDLAELMANGCRSVSAAAREMRMSQQTASAQWRRICADLGDEQCR